jgi:hypothetical protein
MTIEQAMQELLRTGKASPEAQNALFEAGFIDWDPFKNRMVPTDAGREAVRNESKTLDGSGPLR